VWASERFFTGFTGTDAHDLLQVVNKDLAVADLAGTGRAFDLGSGFTLTPHVGRQTIPNQNSATNTGDAADYTDYALTLAKDFGSGLTGTVAAMSTDAKENFYTDANGRFLGKSVVLVGVKYSF